MTEEEKQQTIQEFNDFFFKAHSELRQLENHLENELKRVRELIKTTPNSLLDVVWDDIIKSGNDFAIYLTGFGAARNEEKEAAKILIGNRTELQDNQIFMEMMYTHLRECYKDDPEAKDVFLEYPFIHYLTERLEGALEDQRTTEREKGLRFNDAILPFFKGYMAARGKMLEGEKEDE